jgi:hypothetical protein
LVTHQLLIDKYKVSNKDQSMNSIDEAFIHTTLKEIVTTLAVIQKQGTKIMTALDDLNVSVGALQVSAQNAVNAISVELAKVTAAIAAANTLPAATSAEIETSVASINQIAQELNTAVASISVANTPASN